MTPKQKGRKRENRRASTVERVTERGKERDRRGDARYQTNPILGKLMKTMAMEGEKEDALGFGFKFAAKRRASGGSLITRCVSPYDIAYLWYWPLD
jgi:hypothetical protein